MLHRHAFVSLASAALAPMLASSAFAQAPTENLPAAADALPAELPGAIALNTTDVWAGFNRFNPFPEDLTQPESLPYLPVVGDFATDIAPWVGEWVLQSFVPRAGTNVFDDMFARSFSVMAVTDEAALDDYLELLVAELGEPEEREYEGTTIWVWEPEQLPEVELEEAPESSKSPALEPPYSIEEVAPPGGMQPELTNEGAGGELPGFRLPNVPTPDGRPGESGVRSLLYKTLQIAGREALKLRTGNFKSLELLASGKLAQTWPGDEYGTPDAPETAQPSDETPPVTAPPPPGLAIARLPGYLIAAESEEVLEAYLALDDAGPTLADNPDFRDMTASPYYSESISFLFVDFAVLADAFVVPTNPDPEATPTPEESFSLLLDTLAQQYSSLYSLTWFDENGMRARGVGRWREAIPAEVLALQHSTPYSLVDRLPADTYLSFNSKDLAAQWQVAATYYEIDPQGEKILEALRTGARDLFDLDFEREVVGWMDGEYALFVFPTTGGPLPALYPGLNLGLGIAVETSDRAAGETFVRRLHDWAVKSSDGMVEIVEESVAGQDATSWQFFGPGGKVDSQVAFTWVDSDTLLVTSGTAPLSQLLPQPSQPLGSSELFQSAIAPLPPANTGYLFFNLESFVPFVEGLLPPTVTTEDMPELEQFIGIFRALSVTTSLEPTFEQSDLLLLLEPQGDRPLSSNSAD